MTNLNLNPALNKAGIAETDPVFITSDAALLWLAGLEKNCQDCQLPDSFRVKPELDKWCQPCGGSGKVPVLDLRKLCPFGQVTNPHEVGYCPCNGTRWLPRLGRDALYEAMVKDGWHYSIYQADSRSVRFWRWKESRPPLGVQADGLDSNDWIAAYKAMRNLGYGGA